MKVGFANEIGRISKRISLDARKIMELVAADTKLNLSPYYLKPGFAFGGSCLPKDLRALQNFIQINKVETPILNAILMSNDNHIHHALELIIQNNPSQIGVIGLAFKPETDDLRESPAVRLTKKLIKKGLKIQIYDPNIFINKLTGANREYILNQIPGFFSLISTDLNKVLTHSSTIVVTQKIKIPKNTLALLLNKYVVDLVGWDDLRNYSNKYVGICW